MKKTILFLAVLFSTLHLHAQDYILTQQRDTLFGSIKKISTSKNQLTFKYQGQKILFNPHGLLEFGIAQRNQHTVYRSIQLAGGGRGFARVVQEGLLTIYQVSDFTTEEDVNNYQKLFYLLAPDGRLLKLTLENYPTLLQAVVDRFSAKNAVPADLKYHQIPDFMARQEWAAESEELVSVRQ